jgi:hypothetical protein
MEIEWVTFVESANGEGLDLILKGPGADNLIAKWLPVEAQMWSVVSLRWDFREFNTPEESILRVEIHEPSERELVNWMEWKLGPPHPVSPDFQEGHSGREIKPFLIEFPAEIPGWYDVEFSLNGGKSHLLHLRVSATT